MYPRWCVRTWSTACFVLAHTAGALAQDPFHRTYTTANGLPSDQVYMAMQDHAGYMWFATDAGAARFDGLTFLTLGVAQGVADNEVIRIHEDSQHRVWFLTLNGRLSYWKDGVVHNATTDPELGRYTAPSGWNEVCEDEKGRLWFSGIRGELVRLDL